MASNLSGTARIGRVSGVDVNMGTSDILERLEIGAMILGEALHDSGWGMMKGYAFMRPGDDLSLPLGGIVDATFQISDAMSSTLKYRGGFGSITKTARQVSRAASATTQSPMARSSVWRLISDRAPSPTRYSTIVVPCKP